MESQVVTGVAFSRDEAQITLRRVVDKPGVAAAVFMPLAEAGINVDMIVQTISADNMTDMTFTVPAAISTAPARCWKRRRRDRICGARRREGRRQGLGDRRRHAQSRRRRGQGFRALAEKGVNIRAISTSEIKFSVLIDAAYTELAVRTLHTLYGLDG